MNDFMRVSNSALMLSGTAARPSGRTWRTISSAVTLSGPRSARYSVGTVGRAGWRAATEDTSGVSQLLGWVHRSLLRSSGELEASQKQAGSLVDAGSGTAAPLQRDGGNAWVTSASLRQVRDSDDAVAWSIINTIPAMCNLKSRCLQGL
jgi:hypothetical protein